jgi:hypothetical protein
MGLRPLLAACLASLLAAPLFAVQNPANIRLTIDATGVSEIVALVQAKDTSTRSLERVMALPQVQAVISKVQSFNPKLTAAEYRAGLEGLIRGTVPTPDPFQFARVQQRLPQVREMLARIGRDRKAFEEGMIAMMTPYAPAGLDFEAQVIMVLGGTSDGWVPGGNSFYTAVDMLSGDYAGAVLISAHELYHIAQGEFMPPLTRSENVTRENVLSILRNTIVEGSATLMADPLKVTDGGSWITWFQGKYRNNINWIEQNFALFETLLYRASRDPEVDAGKLYMIGFSGIYGSPLYFVGYRMGQQIEKYDGRDSLVRLYQHPVPEFFRRYLALVEAHPEDSSFVSISPVISKLIEDL